MNPLFDLNGDGKMDLIEFMIATSNDPRNPLYEKPKPVSGFCFDDDENDDDDLLGWESE